MDRQESNAFKQFHSTYRAIEEHKRVGYLILNSGDKYLIKNIYLIEDTIDYDTFVNYNVVCIRGINVKTKQVETIFTNTNACSFTIEDIDDETKGSDDKTNCITDISQIK